MDELLTPKEWLIFLSNKKNEFDRKVNSLYTKRGFAYTILVVSMGLLIKRSARLDFDNFGQYDLISICIAVSIIFWFYDLITRLSTDNDNFFKSYSSIINIPHGDTLHIIKLKLIPLSLYIITVLFASIYFTLTVIFSQRFYFLGFVGCMQILILILSIGLNTITVLNFNTPKIFLLLSPKFQDIADKFTHGQRKIWVPFVFLVTYIGTIFFMKFVYPLNSNIPIIYESLFWLGIAFGAIFEIYNIYWELQIIPNFQDLELAILRKELYRHEDVLIKYEESFIGRRAINWVEEQYTLLKPLHNKFKQGSLNLLWILRSTIKYDQHVKYDKKDIETKKYLIKCYEKQKIDASKEIYKISVNFKKALESNCLNDFETLRAQEICTSLSRLSNRILSLEPRINQYKIQVEKIFKNNSKKPDKLLHNK